MKVLYVCKMYISFHGNAFETVQHTSLSFQKYIIKCFYKRSRLETRFH